jgi:hypothetical protein
MPVMENYAGGFSPHRWVIALNQGLRTRVVSTPCAFVKRTRTSQEISIISGSMLRIKCNVVLNRAGGRCCPSPTAESNLNGRFEGPRKKDPAAMNTPKHMHQRCRAMRFVPRTLPRTGMRMLPPAQASSITEPMKKDIPTGTPSCELALLRTTFRPFIQVRIPTRCRPNWPDRNRPIRSAMPQ